MPLSPSDAEFINREMDRYLARQRNWPWMRYVSLFTGIAIVCFGFWLSRSVPVVDRNTFEGTAMPNFSHHTAKANEPVTQSQLLSVTRTIDAEADRRASLAATIASSFLFCSISALINLFPGFVHDCPHAGPLEPSPPRRHPHSPASRKVPRRTRRQSLMRRRLVILLNILLLPLALLTLSLLVRSFFVEDILAFNNPGTDVLFSNDDERPPDRHASKFTSRWILLTARGGFAILRSNWETAPWDGDFAPMSEPFGEVPESLWQRPRMWWRKNTPVYPRASVAPADITNFHAYGFGYLHGQTPTHISRGSCHYRAVVVPLVVPLGLFLLIPVVSLKPFLAARRRRLRRARGLCETCGYDLRATTSGRCPECGATSPA